MRKTFALLCALVLLLCGCMNGIDPFDAQQSQTAQPSAKETADEEFRGAWVSYLELNPQKLTAKKAYRAYLHTLLDPLRKVDVRDLFVQVRPFADAIYPSALFPASSSVTDRRGGKLAFDYFAEILKTAGAMGFRVHAWINPYRVLGESGGFDALQSDPVVGSWLKDGAQRNVLKIENGVFLNPASPRAQTLILDGVRELLETYDFAGVHLDDYFYPTTDSLFDAPEYAAYRKTGGGLSLSNWRIQNVNALMRSLYSLVKAHDSEMLFSVSPCADIEKNLTVHYADVRLWGSESGYCDLLIPQIYFGFDNQTMPFERVAQDWRTLCTAKRVRLCVGLAAYKIGREDLFAGSGKGEWQKNEDLLARQLKTARALGYDGFALFSAKFVNFQKTKTRKAFQLFQDVV